ncbi:uncharacterized protein LOC120139621 [Hibiscus syriacus]|uniref:uncharacterized protein LOC120139621 n=1 Tax=Hibiscus syriacus TaxID=106335 RepID=UPI001924F24D|nr:uncharacterized protein LOC120139621 [Hibiscus syriacus]
MNRWHRNLSDRPLCDICGVDDESDIQIFRNCKASKDLWTAIVHHQNLRGFFDLPLENWLLQNLTANQLLIGTATPWKFHFSSLLWKVWKRRNSTIFEGEGMSNADLYRMSTNWHNIMFHLRQLLKSRLIT